MAYLSFVILLQNQKWKTNFLAREPPRPSGRGPKTENLRFDHFPIRDYGQMFSPRTFKTIPSPILI